MASIPEIQEEIIDEFAMFDDWMQRYEYMIDLGKSLPIIDPQFKTEDYIIKGCQSKVWVHAQMEDRKINFTADSDAIIYKGNHCHINSCFFWTVSTRNYRCRHCLY